MTAEQIAQIQHQLAEARQHMAGLLTRAAGQPAGHDLELDRQIEERYAHIAGCKQALRSLNIAVDDQPEDTGARSAAAPDPRSPVMLFLNLASNQGAQGLIRGPVTINNYAAPDPRPLRPTVHTRLLDQLQWWVRQHRQQSLAHQVQLSLSLRDQPDAVAQTWRHLPMRGLVQARDLPPLLAPLELFQSQSRQLLILGAAGSGKSTLLFELADELIALALQDAQQPIPIILSLASWGPDLLFDDWVVRAIQVAHETSSELACELLRGDSLLLLLDGLDEVAAEHREQCIAAINAYMHLRRKRAGLGPPLVVCCRSDAYFSCQTKLQLKEPFEILPLDLPAVEQDLAALPAARGVLDALRTDAPLRSIATTPLIINVLLLTYAGQGLPLAPAETREQRYAALWDTYIWRMFQRRPVYTAVEIEDALHRLVWLAQTMRAEHHSALLAEGHALVQRDSWLLDDLQPDLLTTQRQRAWYRRLVGVGMGLAIAPISACSLTWALAALAFVRGSWSEGLGVTLGAISYGVYGIPAGLLSGWVLAELWRRPLRAGWALARNMLVGVLVHIAVYGLLVLETSQHLIGWGIDGDWWPIVQSVLFLAVLLGALGGWLVGDALQDWASIRRQEQLVRPWPALWPALSASWRAGLRYGLVSMLLEIGLLLSRGRALAEALGAGAIAGLSVVVLTTLAVALYRAWWPALWHDLSASWRAGLRYGLAGMLLEIGALLSRGRALAEALGAGAIVGLSAVVVATLAVALHRAWQPRDLPDRQAPGEGLRRAVSSSLRRAATDVAALLLVGGPALWLLSRLLRPLQISADAALTLVLGVVCVATVLGSLRAGLGSWFKHHALRAVLARVRKLPFEAVGFLEQMAEQMLLERDGAAYRFRHAELRDHIAGLTPEQIHQIAHAKTPPRRP